jgi:hypothetical protein
VLLLMSACQQYDKNDDELELGTLLENFLVGTSKTQNQRLLADYSQLCSLRETNFSSANKIAEDIIQHRRIWVRDNIEEQIPPTTYDTYVNISKCIASFKKCCPNESFSFLKKFIGYRVLKMRSHPYSVSNPGSLSNFNKHVLRLIEVANQEYRNKRVTKAMNRLP